MDPEPVRLSKSDIWNKVEEFRQERIHNEDIPVNIEVVMQSTLGIHPSLLENLQSDISIEGFISLDFKTIYVDEYQYNTNNLYKRVRFTFAHEIGHLMLHREVIEKLDFCSLDEWKQFRMHLPEDTLGWFEWQAYEFAGRLLVPINQLIIEFKAARHEIQKSNTSWSAPKIDDAEMFALVAPLIAPKFDVSTDVIEKRLFKENIMQYIGD